MSSAAFDVIFAAERPFCTLDEQLPRRFDKFVADCKTVLKWKRIAMVGHEFSSLSVDPTSLGGDPLRTIGSILQDVCMRN